MLPSLLIKKKEPLPLRGSTPSTYTVDSPRDAYSFRGNGGKKGSFWAPLGGVQKGPFWGVF